jgi:hypothetical protein
MIQLHFTLSPGANTERQLNVFTHLIWVQWPLNFSYSFPRPCSQSRFQYVAKTWETFGLVRKISKSDNWCRHIWSSVCNSFYLSVCMSLCPRGTTRFPMDEFSWNSTLEDFTKNQSTKFKFDQNPTRINEDWCMFMIITSCILIRMRSVSEKIIRRNQNTHFVFNNFSSWKSRLLLDNVEKYGTARQATDDNRIRSMRIACRKN